MSRSYLLDYTAHWGGSEHVVEIQRSYTSVAAVVSVMLKIDPTEHNQEIKKIGENVPQIKLKGQAAQTAEQVGEHPAQGQGLPHLPWLPHN